MNNTPPNNHEFEWAPFFVSSTESSTPSTPSPQRSSPQRRRRVFGRLARAGSDARNDNTPRSLFELYPGARATASSVDDSTTTVKMPTKRKASASAMSEKSSQFGPRSSPALPTPSPTDQPMIRSDAIFGMSNQASRNTEVIQRQLYDDLVGSSSDDEVSLMGELANPTAPRSSFVRFPLGRQRETLVRNEEFRRQREEASKKLSAILVHSRAKGYSKGSIIRDSTVRYLPLCPEESLSGQHESNDSGILTALPNHSDRILRTESGSTSSSATWPLNELPVEIFDLITAHLARDDVKSMRLVSKEFEQKVSRSLFYTSVVPFNTELYDMIDDDKKNPAQAQRAGGKKASKGKSKMKTFSDPMGESLGMDSGGLQWQNAMEDKEGKVYKGHGLRVFKGFGPHIKRFGMSFEVSERQLSEPPEKRELDLIESYHGSYDWPTEQYARFATLAGLENTADETSRMRSAFSNLKIVQELALSIDSGLGWLNGPDKSVHGIIFDRPTPIFGNRFGVADHATQAAHSFWTALQQSQQSFAPNANLKEVTLEYSPLRSSPKEMLGLCGNIHADTQLWSSIDHRRIPSAASGHNQSGFGVLYTTKGQHPAGDIVTFTHPLMPADLNKEQKEWLLETHWAQQAFLESYMLSVIDNSDIFGKVTTLNIAKISSRFLPMLAREVFWDALPSITDVTLHVSPDWRTVERDEAGFAETRYKHPSEAVNLFYRSILQERISVRQSVKKLDIGWVGGGEHAEGIFARNTNILPAPITAQDHILANSPNHALVFRYVEHLTLSNCWVTPPMLEGLVKRNSKKALKKITLDSVSLTAHPTLLANPQINVAQFAQLGQFQPQAQGNAAQHPQAAGIQQQLLLAQQMQVPLGLLQGLNPQQLAWLQQQMQPQNLWGNQAPNPAVLQQLLPAGNPPLPPSTGATGTTGPNWTREHREGSWPDLIDTISPGVTFDDYREAPPPWEDPLPPRPETQLRSIEFKSCGYVRLLNHNGFDQLGLAMAAGIGAGAHRTSTWFRSRYASLKPAMMSTSDRYIGTISPLIPDREGNALSIGWGLVQGWSDNSKAEEAEYDGHAPGGTGRFSGIISKGMSRYPRTTFQPGT